MKARSSGMQTADRSRRGGSCMQQVRGSGHPPAGTSRAGPAAAGGAHRSARETSRQHRSSRSAGSWVRSIIGCCAFVLAACGRAEPRLTTTILAHDCKKDDCHFDRPSEAVGTAVATDRHSGRRDSPARAGLGRNGGFSPRVMQPAAVWTRPSGPRLSGTAAPRQQFGTFLFSELNVKAK